MVVRDLLIPIAGVLLFSLVACSGAADDRSPSPKKNDARPDDSLGLFPDHEDKQTFRERTLAADLKDALEQIPGVTSARVFVTLQDKTILSKDRDAPSTAAVLLRTDGSEKTAATKAQTLCAAAIPGIEEAGCRVVEVVEQESENSLVWIGPVQVAASSRTTAVGIAAGVLITNILLATALIFLGLKRRLGR